MGIQGPGVCVFGGFIVCLERGLGIQGNRDLGFQVSASGHAALNHEVPGRAQDIEEAVATWHSQAGEARDPSLA